MSSLPHLLPDTLHVAGSTAFVLVEEPSAQTHAAALLVNADTSATLTTMVADYCCWFGNYR